MDGPEKRVAVPVVSFKDKVAMTTLGMNLWKEAYVKRLCNFFAERAKNEQTFSTGGR